MQIIKKITLVVLASLLLVSFCHPVVAGSGKININTAAKEELVTLTKVGDKIADRIIEYRKAHPFVKPEDIMNVKGVGQKVFDVNKTLIVVKD